MIVTIGQLIYASLITVSVTADPQRQLTADLILSSPFAQLKVACRQNTNSSECDGNGRFEGFCPDLLKLIAGEIPNFNYTLKESSRIGTRLPLGDWDGSMRNLLNGKADLAVGPLAIHDSQISYFAFSQPFLSSGISVMIRKPTKMHSTFGLCAFSFLRPFTKETWCYIIASYSAMLILYIFLIYKKKNPKNCKKTNSFAVYILRLIFFAFTLFVFGFYTANLTSTIQMNQTKDLSTNSDGTPIPISVDDLANQNVITYGVVKDGRTAHFFKHSTVSTFQKMWNFMANHDPPLFVANYSEGISKVRESRGRFAFILDDAANVHENNHLPCDTMKIDGLLNRFGYGIAAPLGSKWIDQLNLAILRLQEKGHLKRLEYKWWNDRSQCRAISKNNSGTIQLPGIVGMFYGIAFFLFMTAVFAIIEEFFRRKMGSPEDEALTA